MKCPPCVNNGKGLLNSGPHLVEPAAPKHVWLVGYPYVS